MFHNRPYGSAATYQLYPKRSHLELHDMSLEPPARLELATSSLPMRCYTTKPRWRYSCHQPFRYNRFAWHPIIACSRIIWRRERDLNSRGTGPRDFQSRALPGYAISARNLAQPTSGFNALACQGSNATDSKGECLGCLWTVWIWRRKMPHKSRCHSG